MRLSTAFFSGLIVSLAIGALACANRGMHAPDDAGPGAAGSAGTAGRGGTSGTAGRGGTGGGGSAGTGGAPTGAAGRGGSGGQPGGAGGCDLAPGANMSGGTCGAMFNFEADKQGAALNAGSTAFTGVMQVSTATFCGGGALAINGLFSGTSGPTTKGEVLINLPNAPMDLTGKTITVHAAADPGCSAGLNLFLIVNTQSGSITLPSPFPISLSNSWKTASVTISSDGGVTTALALSLQGFSYTGYRGTIYIDEIDIR